MKNKKFRIILATTLIVSLALIGCSKQSNPESESKQKETTTTESETETEADASKEEKNTETITETSTPSNATLPNVNDIKGRFYQSTPDHSTEECLYEISESTITISPDTSNGGLSYPILERFEKNNSYVFKYETEATITYQVFPYELFSKGTLGCFGQMNIMKNLGNSISSDIDQINSDGTVTAYFGDGNFFEDAIENFEIKNTQTIKWKNSDGHLVYGSACRHFDLTE